MEILRRRREQLGHDSSGGHAGAANIVNRPDATDTYSVPQNLGYSVNGVERKRTNGQLTLQYAPTDTITTTLDYTYSENKIAATAQRAVGVVQLRPVVQCLDRRSGVLAADLFRGHRRQHRTVGSRHGRRQVRHQEREQVDRLQHRHGSPPIRFGLQFDFHNSTAESGPDSPYGSNAVLGVAGFFRGTTTADFSRDFPVISVQLPTGMSAIDPSRTEVTGSSFRNSYMKTEIQQAQLTGDLEFFENSRLDFGVGLTDLKNRSAYSNVQRDTWGGATDPADYPDSVWRADTVRHYFDNIGGSGNPALFNQFFTFDFETVRGIAASVSSDALYRGLADLPGRPARRGRVAERVRSIQSAMGMGPADARRDRPALREDRCDFSRAGADRDRHHLGGEQRILAAAGPSHVRDSWKAIMTTCCRASTSAST